MKQPGPYSKPSVAKLRVPDPSLWAEALLPELFWIACLHRHAGHEQGSFVAGRLAAAARGVAPAASSWYVMASDYVSLRKDQQSRIVERLRQDSILEELRTGIAVVPLLDSVSPLAFIHGCASDTNLAKTHPPHWFAEWVDELRASGSTRAVLVQATGLRIGMDAGGLVIPGNSPFTDLSTLDRFPETARSRATAKVVRTAAPILLDPRRSAEASQWPRRFWRKTRELQLESRAT